MADRAIIYLPPGGDRWLDPAMAYIARHGYQLVSVVRDWSHVAQMMLGRAVEVVIVARKSDPPPDRVPRIEYLEEEGPAPVTPHQRRPRIIPRGEAE